MFFYYCIALNEIYKEWSENLFKMQKKYTKNKQNVKYCIEFVHERKQYISKNEIHTMVVRYKSI